MKKLIYFFIGAALLAGCANGDEPTLLSREQASSHVIRSKVEAMDIALTHMQDRAGSRAGYSVADVDIVYNSSSRSQVDTLMYAVNFADDKGFVLVSAARSGESILAYADEGCIDVNSVDENSGFSLFMDAATTYVLDRIPIDSVVLNPNPNPGGLIPDPSKPVTTYEKVAPRVTVKWGQFYPEGLYCTNGISGCVQTAMAQMMSYFKQPTSINLGYVNRDKDVQDLDWLQLVKHVKSYDTQTEYENHISLCNASIETHNALGRLCRELGRRNAANYDNPTVTLAKASYALRTFKSIMPTEYKYTDLKTNFSYSSLFDLLQEHNGLAFMGGVDPSIGGHAWVCCGGERITTVSKGVLIDGKDEVIVRTFFYYNWGRNGINNAYFPANVFDPTKSETPKAAKSRANYNQGVEFFYVYK